MIYFTALTNALLNVRLVIMTTAAVLNRETGILLWRDEKKSFTLCEIIEKRMATTLESVVMNNGLMGCTVYLEGEGRDELKLTVSGFVGFLEKNGVQLQIIKADSDFLNRGDEPYYAGERARNILSVTEMAVTGDFIIRGVDWDNVPVTFALCYGEMQRLKKTLLIAFLETTCEEYIPDPPAAVDPASPELAPPPSPGSPEHFSPASSSGSESDQSDGMVPTSGSGARFRPGMLARAARRARRRELRENDLTPRRNTPPVRRVLNFS